MLKFNKILFPKSFNLVWLNRQGTVFHIRAGKVDGKRKKLSTFESIEEVIEELGINRPYVIHVSGSGVVQRTIENKQNYLSDLLINGQKEDFFITTFKSFDNRNVTISFFRRELLEEILDLFRLKKVKFYQVDSGEIQLIKSLGEVFSLEGSYNVKSNVRGEFFASKAEQSPGLIRTSSGVFSYEKLLIESYLKESKKQIEYWDYNFLESPWNDRLEIKEKRTFERFGLIMTTVLLLIVFGNYFYQNHLNKNIRKMESELLIQNDNLALLDRLNLEKERKKILVANAGLFTPRFNAFYLDQIGLSVPNKVVLTKMELYPLDGKLKQKHKINVFRDLIRVQGTTPTNVELDKWISILDTKEWVKTVEVMNYVKNDSLPAEFNIQISIKE